MSDASLRAMLNAFADEYPKAIRRGKGKSWLAAFRSYLDLVECEIEESNNQIPPHLRRAISEMDDKIRQQPFLGLHP